MPFVPQSSCCFKFLLKILLVSRRSDKETLKTTEYQDLTEYRQYSTSIFDELIGLCTPKLRYFRSFLKKEYYLLLLNKNKEESQSLVYGQK